MELPAWARTYSFTEWTEGTTSPYIGKCTQCKTVIRISITQYKRLTENRQGLRFEYSYDAPQGCHESRRSGAVSWSLACPTCQTETHWATHGIGLKKIDGYLNEGKKCDARCTSATGPTCECQCAGENHGADHRFLAT
jgi:hypothetical protein